MIELEPEQDGVAMDVTASHAMSISFLWACNVHPQFHVSEGGEGTGFLLACVYCKLSYSFRFLKCVSHERIRASAVFMKFFDGRLSRVSARRFLSR